MEKVLLLPILGVVFRGAVIPLIWIIGVILLIWGVVTLVRGGLLDGNPAHCHRDHPRWPERALTSIRLPSGARFEVPGVASAPPSILGRRCKAPEEIGDSYADHPVQLAVGPSSYRSVILPVLSSAGQLRKALRMAKTFTQWASPAEVGEWSLDVDNRKQPTEAILWRNDLEVIRLPHRALDNELIEIMVDKTAVSRGSARQLVTELALKCASPKVG